MNLFKVQGPRSKVPGSGKTPRATLGFRLRPSNFGDRDGVALVITLIMLSIITFMAVTFLVLSQRERSSVSTAMDQKTARNASDAGLARVSAELLTRIMFHTNFQDLDLVVSTNYINLHGLHGGVPGNLSPTNVNFEYLDDGGPIVNSQDRNINIASLLFNPRPPVYVVTNVGTGQSDFRYYYDMNRNGRFDRNGNWPVVVNDPFGGPLRYVNSTNGALIPTNNVPAGTPVLTNSFVGDPEWIGVLERPEELHSADNRFIARYSYLVVPIGNALDMNTVHNQSMTRSVNSAAGVFPADGYYRNQGTGPWEVNLAAFLADLNTNIWDANPINPAPFYQYRRGDVNSPFYPGPNVGVAFDDARALLSYRYNFNYNTLASASQVFPVSGIGLVNDNVDEYSDGAPMTNIFNIDESLIAPDQVVQPWPGAENTNHFFSAQDPFDRVKALGFSARLQQVGGSNDSYNAYTFYRMMAQLGTDSAVETNKLNINFKNTDIHGNIVPGMETNLIPWTAMDFFTNAANRILSQVTNNMGVPLSTAYIPLYPTNYYTPAIHRALQLAANIFDATTNQTVPLLSNQTNAYFPSVFRPVFTSQNGQVWISGYREVLDTSPLVSFQFWDFNTASNNPGVFPLLNIYGVPWVVGAKKGLPNFNQFAMESDYQLTRKLSVIRNSGSVGTLNLSDFKARQMFNMTILNKNGIQAWNSYGSAWPMNTRPLRLFATNIFTVRLLNTTNSAVDMIPYSATAGTGTNYMPLSWGRYRAGSSGASLAASQISLSTNSFTLLDGNQYAYHSAIPGFRFGTNYDQTTFTPPQIYIVTTNRLVYALIDTAANRIVDFVNLDDSGKIVDFTAALNQYAQCNPAKTQPLDPAAMWCTNRITGVPVIPDAISQGLDYQVEASLGSVDVVGWRDGRNPVVDRNNQAQIDNFRRLLLNSQSGVTNQTPYNPVFGITNFISWEANDPLVHYTIPDLTDQNSVIKWSYNGTSGHQNHRYLPWDQDDGSGNLDSANLPLSAGKKEPMAYNSDAWDFPTNRFWNVGILGRVHRGTPWQTVYMKSPILSLQDWQKWSGSLVTDTNADNNNTFADASLTQPTDDYRLFDLFTTAIGPSATRGQLNINQTNLAAWSAVLSGVGVLTNADPHDPLAQFQTIGPATIAPAGVYDANDPTPVARIWMGINRARANNNPTNNLVFAEGAFQHLGDVLQTPELTVASPYINTNWPANDEVYERIPQQIMSLLTLNQTPRFVIYSFGQTLHPADKSLVTGGTFNGLCTNYQITAESAVRAVVHVEGTPDPKFVNGRVDSQGRTYPPHLVIEQFNVLGPD